MGMRQNMMERDAADTDQDGKLDFVEFCQFVRDREEGEFTDDELKKRFDALDQDGSGKVDMTEYVIWSLKDSLTRSSDRVVDLCSAPCSTGAQLPVSSPQSSPGPPAPQRTRVSTCCERQGSELRRDLPDCAI